MNVAARIPLIPRLLSCMAIISTTLFSMGQSWDHVTNIDVDTASQQADIALTLEDGILAVGVSDEFGGSVFLYAQHQGGQDQWGSLGTITRSEPWFGHALALHHGHLAIGAPGSDIAGPFTGAIHMYRVDASDLNAPIEEQNVMVVPDAVTNDRFGFAMAWAGDTLLASAMGRSLLRMTGAVFLCAEVSGAFAPVAILPAQSSDVQVPFLRWFGMSLAASDHWIAVAAPFSGFNSGVAMKNIGTVHIYERDPLAPAGWSLDTTWFDATLDPASMCNGTLSEFQRIEIGRGGIAFSGDNLIMDGSRRYQGGAGTPLAPWQTHTASEPGCSPCDLHIVRRSDPSWDFSTALSPAQDTALFDRSFFGWCAQNDSLLVEWYDQADSTWSTTLHVKDQGGTDTWGIATTLAELEPCDDLRGPMVMQGKQLVRASLRRDPVLCGVAAGVMAVQLQVFQR